MFWEYEGFLKTQLADPRNKQRATDLIAYLYWHKMNAYGRKAARWAKEGVRMAPGVKCSQWILNKAEGHAVWDWNMRNHTDAINFYREIVEADPAVRLPYLYLIDNLLADHRADEAERYLNRLSALPDANPVMNEVYRAHIALARFDEPGADRIMEELLAAHPDDSVCLFEAAQYYAGKCSYEKAIACYEGSFEKTSRRPRFQDELMGIADIYEILGDFRKAAETQGRIVDLLETEWGLTEETDSAVAEAKKEQARLLALIK